MNRFKHRTPIPDVGRSSQTDRTSNLGRHVGKNIPIKVRHDDDVEHLRRIRELGRPDIHDPMLLLKFGILGPDFIEHLMKETVGHFHDVILRKARHFLAAVGPGVFEGVTHNLFAARPGDQLKTLGDIISAPVLNP